GYDKDRILVVSPSAVPQWDALKRELLAHPAISRVTASDVVPFEPNVRTAELRVAGADARGRMEFVTVDYDFFETYRIALAAGRSFSADLDGNRQTGVE